MEDDTEKKIREAAADYHAKRRVWECLGMANTKRGDEGIKQSEDYALALRSMNEAKDALEKLTGKPPTQYSNWPPSAPIFGGVF